VFRSGLMLGLAVPALGLGLYHSVSQDSNFKPSTLLIVVVPSFPSFSKQKACKQRNAHRLRRFFRSGYVFSDDRTEHSRVVEGED
jgi:hypothetical protein